MTENSTDHELICLLRKGDEQAFNKLYHRYWADLFKYAFSILRDKDACKDLIQDIFIWVWEHKQGLDIHSPKSYFRTALKYKIANHIRSGNIRESFFEEVAKFDEVTSIDQVDRVLELKELNQIIQKTVESLPLKCLEILKLSREGNLSNKEIAEKLGISVKTVENQITIALRRIRTKVETHLLCFLLVQVVYFN